jgi:hypothetical protein
MGTFQHPGLACKHLSTQAPRHRHVALPYNSLQMLAALTEAGLGPQEVEHLWSCYERAKAAEDKAGFNTGQGRGRAGSSSALQCIQHRATQHTVVW